MEERHETKGSFDASTNTSILTDTYYISLSRCLTITYDHIFLTYRVPELKKMVPVRLYSKVVFITGNSFLTNGFCVVQYI